MEQPKIHTTADTGVRIRKLILWVFLPLCFNTATANPNDQQFVEQLLKKNQVKQKNITWQETDARPLGQSPNAQAAKTLSAQAKTVIFISQSMPQAELNRLFEQSSGRKDILFVLRGFPNGDAKTGMKFIQDTAVAYAKAGKKMPNIMIYPQAFRAYKVSKVPAVLHQNKDGSWYMAQGGLNINNAIASIERHQYKMPLSRQWQVIEPDQAEFMQKQAQKIIDQHQDQWDEENAKAVDQIIQGTMVLPYARANKTDTFTPFWTLPESFKHPETQKVIIPKGTQINILGNDITGDASFLFIDGRDQWQVNFAKEVFKHSPETTILYTKRGKITEELPAAPLEPAIAERLKVSVVPTLLIKKRNRFERRVYKTPTRQPE